MLLYAGVGLALRYADLEGFMLFAGISVPLLSSAEQDLLAYASAITAHTSYPSGMRPAFID